MSNWTVLMLAASAKLSNKLGLLSTNQILYTDAVEHNNFVFDTIIMMIIIIIIAQTREMFPFFSTFLDLVSILMLRFSLRT